MAFDYYANYITYHYSGATPHYTNVFRYYQDDARMCAIKVVDRVYRFTARRIDNPNQVVDYYTASAYNDDDYPNPDTIEATTTRGFVDLGGWGGRVTYGVVDFDLLRTNVPMFDDYESASHYIQTGDDSGAINYNDLHPLQTDFYLTNNGDRITVQYSIETPTDGSPLVQPFDYYKLTLDPDQIGRDPFVVNSIINPEYNTTWDSVVSGIAPSLLTHLVCEITPYKNGTPLGTLTASLGRKWLLFGSTTCDGVVTSINNGSIILHCTTDNRYDDVSQNSDNKSNASGGANDGSEFGGFDNLLTTYQISKKALEDLGTFIWKNDIFSDIKNYNENALSNIVGLHYMPVNVGGSQSTIVLGDIATNVSGQKCVQNMKKVEVANFTFPKYNVGFLGFEPFTACSLYLPFVGMIDLKATDVCGYNVTVEYAFDLVCGSFGVMVYTSKGGGKTLIYSNNGVCAVTIPLSSSNQAQAQASMINSGLSAISDAVGGNLGGALSDGSKLLFHPISTSTFGTPSSMVGALCPNYCYYIIRTPLTSLPNNFAHTKGYLCMQTYKLSELKGFTKLTEDVDISGLIMTKQEQEELLSILTSGFYL